MNKVLIGYDGSPCADAALDDLTRAGLPEALEALVLSVADVWLPAGAERPGTVAMDRLSRPVRSGREAAWSAVTRARDRSERCRDRLLGLFPTWRITAEETADAPAWALIKKAADWGADLVVVGSHGHRAARRALLGSLSHKVATEAECSVRIARARRRAVRDPPRIAVALDGSSDSEATLRSVLARDWPEATGFRLLAMAPPPTGGRGTGGDEWLSRALERLSAGRTGASRRISAEWLRGRTGARLLEQVREWDADCLFLGARALEPVATRALGALASAVAARAPCSVEVVRPRPSSNGAPGLHDP